MFSIFSRKPAKRCEKVSSPLIVVERLEPSWTNLLIEVRRKARLRESPLHGEVHWRAVAATFLHIQKNKSDIDLEVGLAFALFHDSQRQDEMGDTWHGEAAAEFVASSDTLLHLIGPARRDQVFAACALHNEGYVERNNRSIGACLDADRLNLVRIGIQPKMDYMSVIQTENEMKQTLSYVESIWRDPPEWDWLFSQTAFNG